jgi:hypothetical protein
LTKLAKQDDPPEVIRVMRRQALQLFASGHDADGIASPRRTTNLFAVSRLVVRDDSDLLEAIQEALPQLIPGLGVGVSFFREAGRWLERKGRLDTSYPIQGHLLPEGDMP